MKVNSNTVSIAKESSEYKALEDVITKIASENEINNVEKIHISLNKAEGILGFKIAESDDTTTSSEDPQLKPENVDEEIATEMTESNR